MGTSFFARVKQLQNLMEDKFDKILISDPNNIYYYTGHKTADDMCFLVVDSSKKPHLFVSPLVNEAKKIKTARVSFIKKDFLSNELKDSTIGFEDGLPSGTYISLRKSKIKLKPSADMTYKPREIKDSYEIMQMKHAIKIVGNVLKDRDKFIGMNEDKVARDIELYYHKHGRERSFQAVVATGSNGQYIHYTPGSQKIKPTDLTVIDTGAKVNGYCSDITRTLHPKLNSEKKKIHSSIKEIQGKLIDVIEEGMTLDLLQKTYESLMKVRNYKVKHMISHGIGLSVHESVNELKSGMVITVEPGVYTNRGGCRIEDMILIKKSGVKVLSDSIPL